MPHADMAVAPAPAPLEGAGAARSEGTGSAGAIGGVEVRLRDVSLGYPTDRGFTSVLEHIDLHLTPGECLAVVGASGCGKSTLLHALAGLLEPVSGQVDVTPTMGGRAAYMFQNDLLLPWKTVLANASFAAESAIRGGERWSFRGGRGAALDAARERALALLHEFGLEDSLHLYPHQLSGGMRQRVALARTLALGRGLILLDEPFGSLDAITRSDLREWMARVMDTHPATWVLVTHDVDEAVQLADRVAVLGGRPAGIMGSVDVTPARRFRGAGNDDLSGGALRRAAVEVRALLEQGRTR